MSFVWHSYNFNFHNFNKEEGCLLHTVMVPCPGKGPLSQLASQGAGLGTGSPGAPVRDLFVRPTLWLWAEKMPECDFGSARFGAFPKTPS